ncbi:MAG: hypothetical protein JSR18_04520 [Proteobacteria bacterium]|nr:hypothetical protein [Pseudomonadota bacterium]
MALIGSAVMLLWYDIVPERVADHDAWHTREHFPERVGIPGFLRAQRWVAHTGTAPRYCVSYEVRDLAVLTSGAYQQRLDHPTAWTQSIMPAFRGMVRSFCAIERSIGTVLGAELLTVRYAPADGREAALEATLADTVLPAIEADPAFASAAMLRAHGEPPMTTEQRLRGVRDARAERVLLATSYAPGTVAAWAQGALGAASLVQYGASAGAEVGCYRLACRSDALPLVALAARL